MAKIFPYLLALTGSLILSNGCSTTEESAFYEENLERGKLLKKSEIIKILEVEDSTSVENYKGYSYLVGEENHLELLAGVYSGDVIIRKEKYGYETEGFYERKQVDFIEKVLEEADKNNDQIVTWRELMNFGGKLIKKKVKP